LYTYRGLWSREQMRVLAPGAVVGIALGAVTFAVTSEDAVRLIIGAIAIGFTLWRFAGALVAQARRAQPGSAPTSWTKGSFWSGVAGYTSFIAHAGGPPVNVYLLPLQLDKTTYVGTT